MEEYRFKQVDFENPSLLFVLEDKLRSLMGGRFLYRAYIDTFQLKGDEKVLDFGCGGGAGSRCLANRLGPKGHLTCVDISSRWIAIAQRRLRRYRNVKCTCGDIRTLEILDSSFDVVSMVHVIHDIAPQERQGIVAALSRKLKAGGTLFIREPIKTSHGMPVEEIHLLLSRAGLEETRQRQTKSEYMGKYCRVMADVQPG